MFKFIQYSVVDRIAHITLNRPDRLNAICHGFPQELEAAVRVANSDDCVHVILLSGAGSGFCSGYDLKEYAESPGFNEGYQRMPWDPMVDYAMMQANTAAFMSLWRSYKPTICAVHGPVVGGGSDIALCCDVIVAADTARIGYPPARCWGCPTTGMWVYRVGAQQAKRLLLTGAVITGAEAYRIGLVSECVPERDLKSTAQSLARRMAEAPRNQLMMMKLMVNAAVDNMGLASTQMVATVFDGIARHTPEGVAFKQRCEAVGFKQAVKERDENPTVCPATPSAADTAAAVPYQVGSRL